MNKTIARWESKSRKHWVELYHDGEAATYHAADAGGCLGAMSEAQAIAVMQRKVDHGYFLPDSAKTGMRRVF